jgi:hypothetical protein
MRFVWGVGTLARSEQYREEKCGMVGNSEATMVWNPFWWSDRMMP